MSVNSDSQARDLSVKIALQSVQARLEKAAKEAGRTDVPRLVAVGKTKPSEMIMDAYEVGQRHFGENYAQELVRKAEELPKDICWHYIGPLQSNKAKLLSKVENLWCVETVDRIKIADALNKEWVEKSEPLRVMLQVNVSEEEAKSGAGKGEAVDVANHIVSNCPGLSLIGLMTIGMANAGPDNEDFKSLASLRNQVAEALNRSPTSLELSMGMSGDFETATKLGSTNVRVGSTIFGARFYPNVSAEATG
ncbi:hypothetical protein NDN08_004150 [Rhodosorus marinus]|uniref:Pyridoxal phosphate homeostasis protein n=1 Tax=Rhodosorus marinus TaxID=101924 RepID=A0AAV8UK52_9RHOD|nr:hypothetical protein NDN08_004150 [Rhodosorus marinus]